VAETDAPGAEPLLRFVDVHKHFDSGPEEALRGLNLDVHAGEFLTLLGPSGSGKTTALMMIAGFETLTSGDLLFKGESIASIPAYERSFGVVFQSRALFPHLSVLQNVAYPLRMRGVPKNEANERAREALAMVQLTGLESRPPGRLVGGEQQRVALARALVFEPEVVLMDEPLAALDVALGQQILMEIGRLHEELGNTVIYATQAQSEAITISDRIAVIHDGLIEQTGSPEGLYTHPETSFVATFVGDANSLRGTVTTQTDTECEVTLDTGEEIHAVAVNVDGAGARTNLSVRPEKVLVNPGPEYDVNRFKATVTALSFRGDHTLLRLKLASGTELTAKIGGGGDNSVPDTGESVEVAWQPRYCRALDPLP